MYILGINAVYHDPAACLVHDGRVIAAAEEERFTHVKHGKRPIPFSTYELPFHAVDYCLREAGITLADIDHVAYSYDPWLLLSGHRHDATITLPLEPSAHLIPAEWESAWDPLFLASIVNAPRHLLDGAPHHLQARFSEASKSAHYRWHFVEHHIAHAASAFHASPFETAAVLTLDGRGEKATTSYSMGRGNRLQWLGQVNFPHSLGLLYEDVTAYLGFLHSSDEYKVMALASFGKPRYVQEFRDIVRLGKNGQFTIEPPRLEERFGPARRKGGPLDQRHYDIAHSLQVVLEDTVEEILTWSKLPYRRLKNVAEETADILVRDKVIGWFQGRIEFGPRALGARSILASPIHAEMQARLNEIKDREDFRPVAPVVLEEEAPHWFAHADVSPFMLFVYDVLPEKADYIPAVRHVDGTARIQTINRQQHPLYYDLIKAFQARTGVPVLINTSFNTRGEPIVCTPRDAIECFWTAPLDALVIGSFLLEKTQDRI